MRKYTLLVTVSGIIFFATAAVQAQVAISSDGSAAHPSAMLEVKSSTRGFLLPRMTTVQRTTLGSAAIAGVVVYDTDLKKIFSYNGTMWDEGGVGNYWLRIGGSLYPYNSSDNVGIGTTAPARKLEVVGGWQTARLTSSSAGAFLEFKGTNATNWAIGTWGSSGRLLSTTDGFVSTNDEFSFSTSTFEPYTNNTKTLGTSGSRWKNTFSIDGDFSGSVGIGTSTPARALEVKGAYRTARLTSNFAGAFLEFVGTNATDWSVGAWDGTARLSSSTDEFATSTDEFSFGTTWFRPWANDTKYLGASSTQWKNVYSIDGSFTGKVGVGTQTPIGKLQVHDATSSNTTVFITPKAALSGDSSTVFFAEDNDASYGMYWTYDGNGNQMELWGKADILHYGPHIRVGRENGNVAIGTVFASGYRLSVSGKIICTELKVNAMADWPDYVFRKDYKLFPLEKLGAYIEANGHLPNIPPAAEINKSGIDVGEMQRRMMEKIEELSLYIVDQQKQIKALKEQISSVQK